MWRCLGGPLTWFLSPSQTSELGRGDQDLAENPTPGEASSLAPTAPPPAKEQWQRQVASSDELRPAPRAARAGPSQPGHRRGKERRVTSYNEERGSDRAAAVPAPFGQWRPRSWAEP